MTHKEIEKYILAKPGSFLDYPFGEGVAVYKVSDEGGVSSDFSHESGVNPDVSKESRGKMFALIQEGSDPLKISLKCDPILAEQLREKYESIMPGYHLNKKHWNTILLTGQLDDDYLLGLIDLSYQLVSG